MVTENVCNLSAKTVENKTSLVVEKEMPST